MTGQTSKALKVVILVYAIWWAIYGLLHVVSPELVGAIDPAIERVFGATVVALAVGAALAYMAGAWDRAKIMVQLLAVWTIFYTIAMAWGILGGGITPDAWTPTIIGAVFAVLLVVFYFREERKYG
jgi:hypothetical protein